MYQQRPPQTLALLSDGVQGVKDTLYIMRDWVRASRADPTIRDKAANLVFYLPNKDWYGQIYNVWRFVKDNIRYIRDVYGVETLHYPAQVLAQGFGDCDDQAMLICALLQSIGHPCRFKAVGVAGNGDAAGEFSHVYAQTSLGNGWISLETTEDVNIGWEPQGIVSHYEVNI